MSKISAENLARGTTATYWKLFAASVTAWRNKYEDDGFYRTKVHVITLQVCLIIVSLGIILFVYNLNSSTINAAISTMQEASSQEHTLSVIESVRSAREMHLAFGILTVLFVYTAFCYLIAVVALRPAQKAMKSQKRFIRNIAHELRTPLSIIKTNSEIALLDPAIDTEIKDMVASNIEELDRVSNIIDNMLTLSALERPDLATFTPVDFSSLVRRATGRFTELARACEVRVTTIPSPEFHVWGNIAALEQIVNNVVKNAIIYTPRFGSVTVSVAPTPEGEIELKVTDTGMGISPQDLERIFEPFYRADASRTRGRGGSGIGLTIVSELVRMHRGAISVESKLHRGTTVTIRLPRESQSTELDSYGATMNPGSVSMDFTDQMSEATS